MIITFCGHSEFRKTEEYEQRMFILLEDIIKDQPAQMYLGGYGGFDEFAYDCCKKYKDRHLGISLVLVTPYITLEYQRNHLNNEQKKYDSILYPEIEDKPMRFAITYRNRYMVEKADCVISYVAHSWGGAYKTCEYAKRKGKRIINLADKE